MKKYTNSQHILGNFILKFKSQKEMLDLYHDPEKYKSEPLLSIKIIYLQFFYSIDPSVLKNNEKN